MVLIPYPPETVFSDFEFPENLKNVLMNSTQGFEPSEFWLLYEYLLTKELLEELGFCFNYGLQLEDNIRKISENVESLLSEDIKEKGVRKLLVLRFFYNLQYLSKLLGMELISEEKILALKRNLVSKLFGNVTNVGLETLLKQSDSELEKAGYKLILLLWRKKEKKFMDKLFGDEVSLVEDVLTSFNRYLKKVTLKTIREKIFLYRLYKHTLSKLFSYNTRKSEVEYFQVEIESKFRKVKEEIKRYLENLIITAEKETNVEILLTYLSPQIVKRKALQRVKSLRFEEAVKVPLFSALFEEEIEYIRKKEKSLIKAKSPQEYYALFAEYERKLKQLNLSPSLSVVRKEDDIWRETLKRNLPVAVRELKKIGKHSLLPKELNTPPVNCNFYGKKVIWYPKDEVVLGRFPSGVDIIIKNRTVKRAYYKLVKKGSRFFLMAHRNSKNDPNEMLFEAEGKSYYPFQEFRLKEQGKIFLSLVFFIEYSVQDGFLLFSFGCDRAMAEQIYNLTIEEIWPDYEEFSRKQFLLGT